MDECGQAKRIRHAVDTRLSGLQGDPWMAQRVLANAKGEVKVKKKLSVAFILIMVFILVAVGALAAVLLSMRDIVEEKAVPMATQDDSENYSVEDTNLLLQLAEENGIELSDTAKASIDKFLNSSEGYPKEEMLMALAKAEFGEDPSLWTLEQQKWFDDVCVAIGFVQEPEKAMPTAGENAKYAIIQKANEYIRKTYDTDAQLDDSSIYTVGVQYIDGKQDGTYNQTYWSIWYQPQTLEGSEFWVYLSDSGEILGCDYRLGVSEGCDFMTVYNRFRRLIGSTISTWSQRDLRAFRETLNHCAVSNEKMYLALMQVDYPEPSASAVTKTQAETTGAEAIGLDNYEVQSAVYIKTSSEEVWRICYYVVLSQTDYEYYAVDIDSMTGTVLSEEQQNDTPVYYGIVPEYVQKELKNVTEPSVG
jgi:hypothetical protein